MLASTQILIIIPRLGTEARVPLSFGMLHLQPSSFQIKLKTWFSGAFL